MRWRRVVLVVLLLVVSVPVLFTAYIECYALRARFEARDLLECAKSLRPATMREAEVKERLRPYEKLRRTGEESVRGRGTASFDVYSISNYPRWVLYRLSPHLPFADHLLVLRWTVLGVTPRYVNGFLSKVETCEQQEERYGIHPYIALVTDFSQRFEDQEWKLERRRFDGYQSDGVFGAVVIREYVLLDERATPEQRRGAYGFNLSCFTSLLRCEDAGKLLPLGENSPHM